MLNAALSPARPFDVILLDDSSRLARNTKDALRILEKLNFAGIRLIAVSQGIDSDNEQAHVLVTVHGMADSLYVTRDRQSHYVVEGTWHLMGYEQAEVGAIPAQIGALQTSATKKSK